ncbi:MAG TPA: adenine phosphoribosyltransferase [Clostridiales bacterium]|nr:adenine phosphoribosyltransferase [Clostridiales bacterium]
MNTHKMTIAGITRELPICAVNEHISIAAFIMFGDVEVTKAAATALIKKCPPHDIVITAEAKGIPLCYEVAAQGCNEYVVARKSQKLYMPNPFVYKYRSITTAQEQTLYLSQADAVKLKGRRVLVVDDVISTGESLLAMEELVKKAGGNIVGKAAVLAEGNAAKRNDIIFLEPLPVFEK